MPRPEPSRAPTALSCAPPWQTIRPTRFRRPSSRRARAKCTSPCAVRATSPQSLGASKGGRLLVGFALETHDEQANAEAKLARKNFDFIVLNSLRDAGAGFRGDTNKVTFIDRNGREPLPLMPKSEVAGRIVDKIESLLK